MWKNTTYPLPEFGPYVGSPGNGYMVQCMAYVYCCKQGRILRGEDAAVKGGPSERDPRQTLPRSTGEE